MYFRYFSFSLLVVIVAMATAEKSVAQAMLLKNPPLHYICYRAAGPIIVDGKADEKCWKNAPWSEEFIDIEGPAMPAPLHSTRIKMLWDTSYLYIFALMEEPHLWATLTERESVIFYDNDFEVFIDPDGDTHNYYELEINAFGTEWDLMLTKPYRFGGLPITAWNINGLKSGVHLNGTINQPSDTDTSWSVELAIPLSIIAETADSLAIPVDGKQWRINFSRVHWKLEVKDGKYVKATNPATGKPFPEYNWVWSPQWAINMHKPEYWGYLQFSESIAGAETITYTPEPDFEVKALMRELFNRQYQYSRENNRFAKNINQLVKPGEFQAMEAILMEATETSFIISAPAGCTRYRWYLSHDSRIWKSESNMPVEILPR